jgi:hypothetical protein
MKFEWTKKVFHAAARRPAAPVPSRPPLRRSDRANARCSAASIEGVGECRPTFVTAKDSDPLYPPRPLCASRVALACPRKPRGRACTTPIAPTCIALLPRRRSGAFAPNFCNGQGLRHPFIPNPACAPHESVPRARVDAVDAPVGRVVHRSARVMPNRKSPPKSAELQYPACVLQSASPAVGRAFPRRLGVSRACLWDIVTYQQPRNAFSLVLNGRAASDTWWALPARPERWRAPSQKCNLRRP